MIIKDSDLPSDFNPSYLAYTFHIVDWFCRRFNLDHSDLQIDISGTKKNGTQTGSCYAAGYAGQSALSIRIELNVGLPIFSHNTSRELANTLLHELIHFRQHKRGEMKFGYEVGKTIWKGREFARSKNYLQYRFLPWEREAWKYSNVYFKELRSDLYDKFGFDDLKPNFFERIFT